MQNNRLTNILIGILIIVVLGVGGFLIFSQKNSQQPSIDIERYPSDISLDDFSSNDTKPTTGIPNTNNTTQITNSTQKLTQVTNSPQWDKVTNQQIFTLLGPNNPFEESFGINLTQSIDLTGDGVTEGIFSGNGGNNGLSLILLQESNNIKLAQQKNKDGTISFVQLESVGRVNFSNTWKLIASEKGFYTIAKERVNQTENYEGEMVCGENGFQAYQWNPATKLFEYSQSLTQKYISQECK